MGNLFADKIKNGLNKTGLKVSGAGKKLNKGFSERSKTLLNMPEEKRNASWEKLQEQIGLILHDISKHLCFQKDMTEDSGIEEGMIHQFDLNAYLERMGNEFLKPLVSRHRSHKFEAVELLLDVELSLYPGIDDLLYSRFFNLTLEDFAKRLKISFGLFVKDVYGFYQSPKSSELQEKNLARFKELLKLYEQEFVQKREKQNQDEAEKEKQKQEKLTAELKAKQQKESDKRTLDQEKLKLREARKCAKNDFQTAPAREHSSSHSDQEKNALDMVDGLLFQHGVVSRFKLRKLLRKSNSIILGLRLGLLAALFIGISIYIIFDFTSFQENERIEWGTVGCFSSTVNDLMYDSPHGNGSLFIILLMIALMIALTFIIVGLFRYIVFNRYHHPFKSLKKGIAKIYSGTGVTELFLLENLKDRYGRKVFELLKI